MTASKPMMTIMILTFNRCYYVATAIHRYAAEIMADGGGDVDILIADNCSTDQTPVVVARLQALYPFLRYHRHERNSGTAEENLFSSIPFAQGEFVWACGDDDVPLPGSLAIIKRLIAEDSPDFVMLNGAVTGQLGDNFDIASLKPDFSDLIEEKYIGDSAEFVRETGFTRHITSMSCLVMRRAPLLDMDWREYVHASAIYSHSAIFIHVFHDKKFVYLPKSLIVFTATENDSGWREYGRKMKRSLFFPWAAGLCRLFNTLIKNGIVPDKYYHDIVEVSTTERFTLAGHTLFVIIRQFRHAVIECDERELPSQEEWAEISNLYWSGSRESLTLLNNLSSLAVTLREILPIFRTEVYDLHYLRSPFGRIFASVDETGRTTLKSLFQAWAVFLLESWFNIVPWRPKDMVLIGAHGSFALYQRDKRFFGVRMGKLRLRYGALGLSEQPGSIFAADDLGSLRDALSRYEAEHDGRGADEIDHSAGQSASAK